MFLCWMPDDFTAKKNIRTSLVVIVKTFAPPLPPLTFLSVKLLQLRNL